MKTLLGAVVIAVAVGYLQGCTVQLGDSDRHLTKEQDEEIARQCVDGCRVIPLRVWREIQQRLGDQQPPAASGTST